MTSYADPYLVSERESTGHRYPTGSWDPAGAEDCVPCSVVMALNALHPDGIPATLHEAELLRVAAGYEYAGGTTLERVTAAARTRYSIGPIGFLYSGAELVSSLIPGKGAVAIIRPANMPAGHPFRQYVGSSFAGLHAVYLQRRSSLTPAKVWVLDPMNAAGEGYRRGYWVALADLPRAWAGPAIRVGIARV